MEYLDALTRRVIRSWIARERERAPVFTPMAKPLAACKIALLSSAGLALLDDRPFDQEGEERDPWWGDPSHRVIPRGVSAADVRCCHLHIGSKPLEEDLDCALPLRRLEELVSDGAVGAIAESHYSIMGYLLDTEELERETVPQIIERLRAEAVDALALVPV